MSAYDQIQATLPTAEDNSMAGCLLRHHRGCMQDCACGCHSLQKIARVDVLGYIWWPNNVPCAYSYTMTQRDVWTYGASRADVQEWLGTAAGDFSQILDFAAPSLEIEWADPESEYTYHDCMFPSED